jgi:ribosomal protein S18 acetylase RimI-like enzyme
MKVRPASLSDVAALVALNEHVQLIRAVAVPELFRRNPPADVIGDAFRKMIADPAAFWLIAEDEVPCGYLCAQFHEQPESWFRPALRLCNISQLAVHPEARRKGVARRLIATLVETATQRGFERIVLDVWTFNQGAREAFMRLGFHLYNERLELVRAPASPATSIASANI